MDHREHDQLLKKMVEAELDADAAAQQVTALRDVCQRLKEVKIGMLQYILKTLASFCVCFGSLFVCFYC